MLPCVAEEQLPHDRLDVRLVEEVHLGEGARHVLADQRTELLVLPVPMPPALRRIEFRKTFRAQLIKANSSSYA